MNLKYVRWTEQTMVPAVVVAATAAWVVVPAGCPLFFNIDFPWLFHDQKMKIHDLSAQHLFPTKRYMTYECIPELVVTVPSARSTIVKKIKRFIIWVYKWSHVTFTELLSAVVKIPWHYHHFPWLFHDFPWPLLFSMTFQAWKMVFLNSMTFHDQRAPCTCLSFSIHSL